MTDPISDADLAKLKNVPINDIISMLNLITRNGELRDYDDELANRAEDAKSLIRAFPALISRLTNAEQDRDDARNGWEQAAETIRMLDDAHKCALDCAYADGREAMREEIAKIADSRHGVFESTFASTIRGSHDARDKLIEKEP